MNVNMLVLKFIIANSHCLLTPTLVMWRILEMPCHNQTLHLACGYGHSKLMPFTKIGYYHIPLCLLALGWNRQATAVFLGGGGQGRRNVTQSEGPVKLRSHLE